MSRDDLVDLLGMARLDLSSEGAAQSDLAVFLASTLPPSQWAREFRLNDRDRPDFVVWFDDGALVIEMKAAGQRGPLILGQLRRYAEDPRVAELVLMTNTAAVMPSTVNRKPLTVISLGRSWL